MLKAILFDMDGVLVDSEPVHFAANYKMMKDRFGIELLYDDYKLYIGSTVEKIWKYFREKYGLTDYSWQELMDMAEEELAAMVERDGYPEIPGAAEAVRMLGNAGYRLAVASSSPMAKIRSNMERLGITDCFDAIVSGMELKNPKPSPDIFLKAAELLGVEPDECIVIEDSCNGTRAAKAAGMACLGFVNPHSGNQDLSQADYLFEDFGGISEPFVRMVHNHCFGLPWKVLETDRLVIREMCEGDIDALMEIYSSPAITRYMDGLYPRQRELDYMRDYISNVYGFYGYGMWMVEKKDGTVIGRAGIEYYENVGKKENECVGILTAGERNSHDDGEDCHLLGYVIAENEQRKGYGFEACSAVIGYAFRELGISKICVRIQRDNLASIGLAEKLGFDIVGNSSAEE